MNGPESKPCAWPIRRPSLNSAPAREASASAAKRQARGEPGERSRWSSAKLGAAASGSAGMGVEGRLHELADAVALVSLARQWRSGVLDEPSKQNDRPVRLGANRLDHRGVGPVGRPGVRGEQLREVLERAERVRKRLLAIELGESLVDRLSLGRAGIGVGVQD